MQLLKKHRTTAKGLPDLLEWAALIDEGIILNKSGTLMAGYYYRGTDISSSTDEERNYIVERVNASLAKLGNGWVTWHDAVRMTASEYPLKETTHFPDEISQLIDEERRQQFLLEGAHYESEYTLIFLYTPPQRKRAKLNELMWDENGNDDVKKNPADKILMNFKRSLSEIEDTLSTVLRLRRMLSYNVTDNLGNKHFQDELVNYLKFCLTGDMSPINIPPYGMYLDAYIGGKELWMGDTPRVDEKYICCVAIEGFPHESYPNILDILERLPIAYRWSTRMIYLDQHTAINELETYRSKWKQKMYGFWSQVFKTGKGIVNEDAQEMTGQAQSALTAASSAVVTFGYYTPTIVLMGEDREEIVENGRHVKREIERLGFICRVETVNAMEAWLGSLPGHPVPNIRRPLIHTWNQADLLPLSSVWAGLDSNPCSFYPPDSPPLAHTAASGATPFRLNLHVGDVGHTLVIGPTGAGKSTLLCFIAAQFRRYEGATICAFDKGRSMWALVNACGGKYYDMGGDHNGIVLAPLSSIDQPADMAWAQEWITTCFELQAGKAPSPSQREKIYRALNLLQAEKTPQERSLTDFVLTVQDEEIRAALSHYTVNGALGYLLDGFQDKLEDDSFSVFEIEEIMNLGEKNVLPILLYLFRRFEKTLTGQPAILILNEAWVMLGHSVFREKIREWLKVLRKSNCAVVLDTQSLSDTARSGIFDVLLESCKTKILLPNYEADKAGTAEYPGPRDLYSMIGLNDTQINILKTAIPKRNYYYMSPEGNRLFNLGLGPIALAFTGVSDKKTVAYLQLLHREHGGNWPFYWLNERGICYER